MRTIHLVQYLPSLSLLLPGATPDSSPFAELIGRAAQIIVDSALASRPPPLVLQLGGDVSRDQDPISTYDRSHLCLSSLGCASEVMMDRSSSIHSFQDRLRNTFSMSRGHHKNTPPPFLEGGRNV
jgi:hypothetical protein